MQPILSGIIYVRKIVKTIMFCFKMFHKECVKVSVTKFVFVILNLVLKRRNVTHKNDCFQEPVQELPISITCARQIYHLNPKSEKTKKKKNKFILCP
jgi:hypothetical protein